MAQVRGLPGVRAGVGDISQQKHFWMFWLRFRVRFRRRSAFFQGFSEKAHSGSFWQTMLQKHWQGTKLNGGHTKAKHLRFSVFTCIYNGQEGIKEFDNSSEGKAIEEK